MGKKYRPAKGKMIDMDALRVQSEKTTAVGNMGVNGRGDKLGRGGKVASTVEQQTRAYYRNTPKQGVKTVSVKEDVAEETKLEEIKENMPEPEKKSKPKKKKTIKKSREVELEDGSIEIVEEEVEEEDES